MWQKIFMILLDINHIRGYINYNNCTNSYSTVVTEQKHCNEKIEMKGLGV